MLIGKANNVSMYFEPCNKIHDYIKEVEICPIDDDADMSNEGPKCVSKQLSSSSSDKEMQDSDSVHSKAKRNALDNIAKSKKTTIMHLNSLSSMLGNLALDNMHIDYHEVLPEIIFHSRFCPIPVHGNAGLYVDQQHIPMRPVPDMNYASKDEHSEGCHGHKEHEKAICRIYDCHGKQVPFDIN